MSTDATQTIAASDLAPKPFGANHGQDDDETVDLPMHKWMRKLKVETIARESIQPAPYNPRHIDAAAQVKLKGILKRFGMVEPLIWNQRTGNLVGGHQRLKIMDAEHGADHGYAVEVSVVDLPETQERELNIALNNPGAQGFYELQKLANLLAQTKDIDIELAGFDPVSLRADLKLANTEGLDFSHIFPPDDDPAQADADEIAAMKAAKGEYRAAIGQAAQDGFYLQLVFGTVAEKEKFCEALDISPEVKLTSGRNVAVKFGIDIGWTPPADPEAVKQQLEPAVTQNGEAVF